MLTLSALRAEIEITLAWFCLLAHSKLLKFVCLVKNMQINKKKIELLWRWILILSLSDLLWVIKTFSEPASKIDQGQNDLSSHLHFFNLTVPRPLRALVFSTIKWGSECNIVRGLRKILYGKVPGTCNPFVDVYPLSIRKTITSFLPRKNVASGLMFECELLCDPGVWGTDGFMRHGKRKVFILLPQGPCLG